MPKDDQVWNGFEGLGYRVRKTRNPFKPVGSGNVRVKLELDIELDALLLRQFGGDFLCFGDFFRRKSLQVYPLKYLMTRPRFTGRGSKSDIGHRAVEDFRDVQLMFENRCAGTLPSL